MARIRATPGAENLPMYCVGDLHGTLTPRWARCRDGMIFYRECPHTDQFDSAVLSTELLARCLKSGVRPKHLVLVTPIVWPPTGTGTRDGPMRALEDAARRIEKEVPGVLAVNIVGGYAFSDVPHAGVAFSVITEGSEAAAQEALARTGQIAWDMRQGGIPKQHDLDQVVRDFKDSNYKFGGKGPVLLVEPSDNIGGGAPGDGTDVMRALLKYDIAGRRRRHQRSGKRGRRCSDVPIGGKITLPIGGKGSPLDPGPVTLEVELISRSDGVFELEDKNSHLVGSLGKIIRMGPCAVVKPSRPDHPAHQQEAAALRSGPMAQPGHQSRRTQHDRHQGGGGSPRRLWQDRRRRSSPSTPPVPAPPTSPGCPTPSCGGRCFRWTSWTGCMLDRRGRAGRGGPAGLAGTGLGARRTGSRIINAMMTDEPAHLCYPLFNTRLMQEICGNINESLLLFDWQFKPHPNLARAFEMSPDGLTYTFHLRPTCLA